MNNKKTEIIRQMNRVSCARKKSIRRWVSDQEINHSQHMMLMYLARAEGLPSQAEIARAMGVSEPAVATTLKKMQKEGLIVRNMREQDNRYNEIHVTEKGKKIIEDSRAKFAQYDKMVLAGISAEEIDALGKILMKIADNLERIKEEGNV